MARNPIVDRAVFDLVEASASTVVPVLLVGEPGTGMAAIAQLVHGLSPFASGPFIAAKSTDILADVAAAATGTLYFEDIDGLSPEAQSELTGVLGQLTTRIIASGSAADDRFKLTIEVPPLRERPEDVPDLVRHFLDAANKRTGSRVSLTPKTIGAMQVHRWPGNLVELEGMVDALVRAAGEETGVPSTSAEYRLPVRRETATLTLANGTHSEGTLFFQVGEKIGDIFEPGEPFLPVAGDGKVRLYARGAIACISLPRGHVEDDEIHLVVRKVTVRMRSGHAIEGEVRYAPSIERARAADYLNTGPKGFAVHAAGTVHYVAKDHVEYVEENEG